MVETQLFIEEINLKDEHEKNKFFEKLSRTIGITFLFIKKMNYHQTIVNIKFSHYC
jgi:hypothetical protein